MQALKIEMEGLVTSFRYPHFIQGRHPTFEMPPPATIYGHVCSTLGEWDEALRGIRFAYHFSYEAKFEDYEHLHFFGKEPKMNPFVRELLYRPRLTLYLDEPSLLPYFQQPRYPVILGRAQDLMMYTDIQEITLISAERAFFNGTLLSLREAAIIGGSSYAVTMPRYIDLQRRTTWGQYAILPETTHPPIYPSPNDFLVEQLAELWVDPYVPHPYIDGLHRGIRWRTWQGED